MQNARALLRYTLSSFDYRWEPDAEVVARFMNALARHNVPLPPLDPIVLRSTWILGALDAHTRLRFPHCPLQRALLIAAAIAETQPGSAATLLPRKRSIAACMWLLLHYGIRSTVKHLIGITLLLHPSFLKRNAGIL